MSFAVADANVHLLILYTLYPLESIEIIEIMKWQTPELSQAFAT